MSDEALKAFSEWARQRGANDRDLDGVESRNSGLMSGLWSAWLACTEQHAAALAAKTAELDRLKWAIENVLFFSQANEAGERELRAALKGAE